MKHKFQILGSKNAIDCFPRIVFPFLSIQNYESEIEKRYFEPEGTGFFIHENGLFVTAKHVPYIHESPLRTFIAIHGTEHIVSVRHVRRFTYHETADICVGFLDKLDVKNRIIYPVDSRYLHLKPNFNTPSVGDRITSFGYGGSVVEGKDKRIQDGKFSCQWAEGEITTLMLEGRDKYGLPGATIESTVPMIGKASGGPVFNEAGEIIGVNSRSFDMDPPLSYFTPIDKILELEINHDTIGKIRIGELFDR